MGTIKKAIIPAAGIGTRMLPATKAIPKEMVPIVDKPVIQYVVEEAVAAGITDILIIISEGKEAIQKHFQFDEAKEIFLLKKGKNEVAESLRKISDLAKIQFVYQKEQKGLGDAIWCGKDFVGEDPFAILLGDSIIESFTSKPVLKQMVECFERLQSSIVALTEVDKSLVYKYGVMAGNLFEAPNVFEVKDWVEKPKVEEAPSNLVVSGLYIFTSTIFKFLENLPRGVGNEIQLTDAMRLLLSQEKTFGYRYDGKRYDIGSKLDFIKTNLIYGLKNEQMRADLKIWLKGMEGSENRNG